MTMTTERYLTAEQVAARMQVNPETVRRWLRSGRLRGFLAGSARGGWRVAESDLQDFIRANRPGDGDDA